MKDLNDSLMNQRRGGFKRLALTGLLGAVAILASACSSEEPREMAPADKNEPVLIAEADTKDEEKVSLKEKPVVIDYKAGAEDILAQYTEEGMSHFKLNFPDTFSMEYALKNIGKELPFFEGITVDGKKFSTKSLKGKPFVLNVSKTTCPVCEEMSPIIQSFGKNEQVPVISLYPVDKTAEVGTFRKKMKADPASLALVADKNDWLKSFAVDTLSIAQVPTLIFVDESGRISYTYIGKTDDVLLKDMKEKAFGKEKLYNFVRTEVIKVDADGKEIKEEAVKSEPLESAPAPVAKETPKENSKEVPVPTTDKDK